MIRNIKREKREGIGEMNFGGVGSGIKMYEMMVEMIRF